MAASGLRWGNRMSLKDNLFSLATAPFLVSSLLFLQGCSAIMTSATSGIADSLTEAMLDQDDPDTVREAVPAYLLMLDSFILDSPDSSNMLQAGAQLYAAYGVVFVDDPERSKLLTRKARAYGDRALCAENKRACGVTDMVYDDYVAAMDTLTAGDVAAL